MASAAALAVEVDRIGFLARAAGQAFDGDDVQEVIDQARQHRRGRLERLAVDRQRACTPHWLDERGAVEQVEQCDRLAAGSGQAQLALAAGADTQRQLLSVYSSFAFNIPDE